MSATPRPRKNTHYAMEKTGRKHPSKGFEYMCPVCGDTMYYGEAKRHHHTPNEVTP